MSVTSLSDLPHEKHFDSLALLSLVLLMKDTFVIGNR